MRSPVLIYAGITTFVQASIQLIYTGFALAQYFCLIDLLSNFQFLTYLQILYFHNPKCGARVYIGQAIQSLPNQASVLISNESLPTFRTFIINGILCGLAVLWLFSSILLIVGGAQESRSGNIRWPWLAVTALTICVDVSATIVYVTDTFKTRTLTELVDFVGGTLSGAGNQAVDTSVAAWLMVALYSRAGVFVVINLVFLIFLFVECGRRHQLYYEEDEERITKMEESVTKRNENRIPRVNLLKKFSSTYFIAAEQATSDVGAPRCRTPPPPRTQAMELEEAFGGKVKPLSSSKKRTITLRRTEIRGQVPWSYLGESTHRMRDQLPDNEDLPPVPVPDYTIHHTPNTQSKTKMPDVLY